MTKYPATAAVAQTYETPGSKSPLDAISAYEEYQREWASSELGSHVISKRMELPRGRIRSWQNGSKPDVVRGLDTAQEHGWLEAPVDGELFAALNRLVAGVFSGGSISKETFEPSFSATDSTVEDLIRSDLETLGVGCRLVHSSSGDTEELRPDEDKYVLGRVLVALGAPAGPKAETVDRLPAYLDNAPENVRRDFVRVYFANRGVDVDGRDFTQIMEERPEQYLDSLATLIESVVTEEVWHSGQIVRMRKSGLDELGLA